MKKVFYLFLVGFLTWGCHYNLDRETPKLFRSVASSKTGIDFKNTLTFKHEFNIYRYRNFYNGGGVALGDINNDGLVDIYFTGNQVANRLYLNKGDLEFEDITEKAGVAGTRAWSTGVSMADVNGDGLIDIYVCNSGIVEGDDKRNELFINNGDLTFSERAQEFGIADSALSIHGSFFDYDKDGDLDLYLVNNSFRAIGSFDMQKNIRQVRNSRGGDKLFRNDTLLVPSAPLSASLKGGTRGVSFTDVSEEAGIYGSEIGFGLGVSVADLNRDGWPDLYISNDFFERDYLYLNNRNGTFREVLEQQIKSISAASMGADVADLNGDGYSEIFVTDMLPDPESRLKQVTTFDNWEGYQNYLANGYYHQFTRNTLQLNNRPVSPLEGGPRGVSFSEIGRWAGVEATDWSWGANIADFDMDGKRDIFVANGIYQDITNLDYLQKISQEDVVRRIVSGRNVNFKELIDMIPSTPISNYAFHNTGNLQFADSSRNWGLDKPGFSNGSAYGDLDNDGDLELVINNINSEASVYENRATELYPDHHWLMLKLESEGLNTNAIGTQITAWAGDSMWYAEQMPIRGFQSTMDSRIHLGLGTTELLDSLLIAWPDGEKTIYQHIKTDTLLTFNRKEAENNGQHVGMPGQNEHTDPLLRDITDQFELNWKHHENTFVDFKRDKLLFHMRSTEGPATCAADANGDGLTDFYVGGAKDQPGTLFLQTEAGTFKQSAEKIIANNRQSEDTDCAWFDGDGDGDQDLYVTSGGNEFPGSSSALRDRYYINDGSGTFTKSKQLLPSWNYQSTGTVNPADFDGDGDIDLFVGARLRPFAVGIPVNGYLLENDGNGQFRDITGQAAPALQEIGMITGAEWGDIDSDGDPDLFVVGEWMPITLLLNEGGIFKAAPGSSGLDSTNGWWKSILLTDLDTDGDLDFIAGNHGLNTRFEASKEEPVELWSGDFDGSGTIEQIISTYKDGSAYPLALRHDLINQLPFLEPKYPTYKEYAGQTIHDIFTNVMLENAQHSEAYQLASVAGWNQGNGTFAIQELPMQAQIAPMYGIHAEDLNEDTYPEILMGGNLHNVKPEAGRYDASYGVVLSGFGTTGIQAIPPSKSGFQVMGEIRNIIKLDTAGKTLLVVSRNNDSLRIFEIAE